MRTLLSSSLIYMLLLAGCGWSGPPTRSNDITPLTAIVLSAETATIAHHTSTRLTAVGSYAGLFSRDITGQVTWSSAAPGVADFVTAAVANQLTGKAAGTAVLKATLGTVSADITVTVSGKDVTGLTITPRNAVLGTGSSRAFTASGTLSDGTVQNLSYDVDWLSSAPGVATISSEPASTGVARGIAEGSTTISAAFAFNGVGDSTLLTVTAPTLQTISITPADSTMLSLTTAPFSAVGSYSDGSTADLTGQVTWSSTGSGTATVSSGGMVKTLATGSTSIQATLGGISGSTGLTVTGGNLTGISISPLNPTLAKETTARLSARGSFTNGSSRDISAAVDWSVANGAFATVTAGGGNLFWLNPLAATGGTTLTARSGLISAETTLIVTAPLLSALTLTPASLEQTAGTDDQLSVIATYSDGSRQDVTLSCDWSSDTPAVATVGSSGITRGRVSAVATGSAIISASYGTLSRKTAITVKTRTLRELTVSGTTSAVSGNQLPLTATATYTDGTSRDVTGRTDWSIDKTAVATLPDAVSQPGEILLRDAGSATLTAAFGGKSITVPLTSRGL